MDDEVKRPTERVRALREAAEAKVAAAKQRAEEEQAQELAALHGRREAAVEHLGRTQADLAEIDQALQLIASMDEELMTDDLRAVQAELQESRKEAAARQDKIGEEIAAVESDPRIVAERALQEENEREAEKKKKRLETERKKERISEMIDVVTRGLIEGEKKYQELRAETARYHDDETRARTELKALGNYEQDISRALAELPEKQQRAIAELVAAAREKGARIHSIHQTHDMKADISPPSMDTVAAWYAAWKDVVEPLPLFFVDRALRTLREKCGNPVFVKAEEYGRQMEEANKKYNPSIDRTREVLSEEAASILDKQGPFRTLIEELKSLDYQQGRSMPIAGMFAPIVREFPKGEKRWGATNDATYRHAQDVGRVVRDLADRFSNWK